MTVKLITLENSEVEVILLRQKFSGSPIEVISFLKEIGSQIETKISKADSLGFSVESKLMSRLLRNKKSVNKAIKKLHKTYR